MLTVLVLLDLPAAFNTIDHNTLLHRLETSTWIGIKSTILIDNKPSTLTSIQGAVLALETIIMRNLFYELGDFTAQFVTDLSPKLYIKVTTLNPCTLFVYFRILVVSNIDTKVSLKVSRVKGQSHRVEVNFESFMMMTQRKEYGVMVYPALKEKDYDHSEGTLVFEPDIEDLGYIDVNLTPFEASSNPYPKQLFVRLKNPTNGAT